jgi:hypothetical protein
MRMESAVDGESVVEPFAAPPEERDRRKRSRNGFRARPAA